MLASLRSACLLAACLLLPTARAEGGDYGKTLMTGLGASVGPSSVGGHGMARLLFSGERWALDLGGREGFAMSDQRTIGALFAGARYGAASRGYARLGFAHHHEVPLAVLQADPVGATIGSADGIRHRSGLELGLGWRQPYEDAWLDDRLGFFVDVSAAWFPDAGGPPVYAVAEVGISLGLGASR